MINYPKAPCYECGTYFQTTEDTLPIITINSVYEEIEVNVCGACESWLHERLERRSWEEYAE